MATRRVFSQAARGLGLCASALLKWVKELRPNPPQSIPRYEPDNGPVTSAMLEHIQGSVPQSTEGGKSLL